MTRSAFFSLRDRASSQNTVTSWVQLTLGGSVFAGTLFLQVTSAMAQSLTAAESPPATGTQSEANSVEPIVEVADDGAYAISDYTVVAQPDSCGSHDASPLSDVTIPGTG